MCRFADGFVVAIMLMVALTSIQSGSAHDGTDADCSPIVKNVGANVSVACNFQGRIPVFKFSGIVSSNSVHAFTEFVNAHENDFIELDIRPNLDEENQLYFVGRVGPPGHEQLQLVLDDRTGGATYTFNSSFDYVLGFYHIKGLFTVQKSGEVRRSMEEVFLVPIDKADLLLRGR